MVMGWNLQDSIVRAFRYALSKCLCMVRVGGRRGYGALEFLSLLPAQLSILF